MDARLAAFATDYQRMWDLVRHQRSALLDDGLITREEYGVLLSEEGGTGSPSARRLESYDELRAHIEALERALNGLRWKRRGGMVDRGVWVCAECGAGKFEPEVHREGCSVLAAIQPSEEA